MTPVLATDRCCSSPLPLLRPPIIRTDTVMSKETAYYDVLGVTPKATVDEINKVRNTLASPASPLAPGLELPSPHPVSRCSSMNVA